ncbi:hypothetical protein SCRDD08_00391 [Streptococcus cristatus]|uniref:Uncharacterized protein n=1 Tax=Streptococcus cristatus TaxID=45634 RepID=A0A139N4Q2_STRCR|nr:hypothetical protein SCRDD08_00391 [Streptococcus cristatus]
MIAAFNFYNQLSKSSIYHYFPVPAPAKTYHFLLPFSKNML